MPNNQNECDEDDGTSNLKGLLPGNPSLTIIRCLMPLWETNAAAESESNTCTAFAFCWVPYLPTSVALATATAAMALRGGRLFFLLRLA